MARTVVDIGGGEWIEVEREVLLVLVVNVVMWILCWMNWQFGFLRAHAPLQPFESSGVVVRQKDRRAT